MARRLATASKSAFEEEKKTCNNAKSVRAKYKKKYNT